MSSVGTYLRELRQRRGVSLEEIARTTRVAQRYLESIEADAFETLPSPVFTRGFIRAYCQALSEPPDEALAAYERREPDAPAPPTAGRPGSIPARAGATPSRPVTATPRPSAATSRPADGEASGKGAVLVSFVLLIVLGVALFAVALVIHPRERGERVAVPRPEPRAESRPVRGPEPLATAPAAPVASAPPSATSAATRVMTPGAPGGAAPGAGPDAQAPAAAPGAPPPTAAPPAAPRPVPTPAAPPPAAVAPPVATPSLDAVVGSVASPYRLVARTNEMTWIRVRTEDGRISEENVPPGEVREWISNRPFTLTIGNAGGVSFELNGRALPPLGPKGLVIPRIVLPPEAR
jgi:cytoskeleton protein RodZ